MLSRIFVRLLHLKLLSRTHTNPLNTSSVVARNTSKHGGILSTTRASFCPNATKNWSSCRAKRVDPIQATLGGCVVS
ncbi:hypothetical protein PR001_g18724 [Phytophthora rubi]|uniref:Secreted protein n=1 Tax=Phytophthora rubi TaxID=129364 RepID=A0A6A3K0R2_9STRA|nr:hypothetical protein PR001_g18724 [Phytophthora rubi]